ncbi:MAG: hypothetical protein KatS3mg023_3245 [Armatimonadota bacterium]|nr:MAG: hypothetical protein KatS3mg023_3245 [Armatimonadota bacterium]
MATTETFPMSPMPISPGWMGRFETSRISSTTPQVRAWRWRASLTASGTLSDPIEPIRSTEFSSLLVDIERLLNELQQSGIRLRKHDELRDYLLRFPAMLDVVDRVVQVAGEHIPEAELWLEVYHDPESEDKHLVIYARFHEYDEATMERIRSTRRAYRPFLAGKSGWLILTTDFGKPE